MVEERLRVKMRGAAVAAGVTILAAAGCYGAGPQDFIQNQPAPPASSFPAIPSGPDLNVLVLGDWGTGGPGQRAVADAIARTHAEDPPAVVLTVGDNVYPSGIEGVDDPRWDFVFSSVYWGPFWDALPFRPTLGNHDYEGDEGAEIEMSQREPRWHMPAPYYSFTAPVPGTEGDSVLFVATDTNVQHLTDRETRAEAAWLETMRLVVNHAYVVTYGHHPIAGGGPHRPSTRAADLVGPFSRDLSTVHLAGHDHILQVVPLAEGSLHAICGGGSGTDDPYKVGDRREGQRAAFTGGGWCMLRFWPEAMAVELYDAEGTLRHRSVLPRP